jgi:hypothetical protein
VCGMFEVKRDAAADLAMCEAATPGPWEWEGNRYLYGHEDELVLITTINGEPLKGTKTFIAESSTALPHWIKRAQDAEKRISAACDKLNSLITLISMAGGAGESVDIWGLSSELCAIASELNSE